jgi:hypothetical protein
MGADRDTPDGIDTGGRAVPPYDGRRESADIADESEATRDGAKVGGATGPVENSSPAAADPDRTARGATGSPADEQPAGRSPETDRDDDRVGPAHTPGTPRGEDQS